MDFTAFDKKKIEEYTRQARETWGSTPQFGEFEQKDRNRNDGQRQAIMASLMNLFVEFAQIKEQGHEASSPEAQAMVKKLQNYITENFYRCTDQILGGLGQMYGCGGEFTENINRAAGEGTAEYASEAIRIYCGG